MTLSQPVPPPPPSLPSPSPTPLPSTPTLSVTDWLTILGIVVSVAFGITTLLPSGPTNITYQITDPVSVIEVADSVVNDIKIYSNGLAVKSLYLLTVTLINNADTVRKEDYEAPIQVVFDKSCKIVSKKFTDVAPTNIKLRFDNSTNSTNTITLSNINLNRGDQFSIKLLVGECKPIPKVVGRILGVSKFNEVNINSESRKRFWLGFLFTLLTMLIFGRIYEIRNRRQPLGANLWLNTMNGLPLNLAILLFFAVVAFVNFSAFFANVRPYEGVSETSSGDF